MGLDIVEMVMAVEAEFNVALPDDELRVARSVGEFHALVAKHLGITEPTAREALWPRLLDVIERETAVKRRRLIPSARFVADLGLG